MKLNHALLVTAVVLASIPFSAQAQPSWPGKPVRLVVPYAAAGGADITARLIARELSDVLGQPVIVENKPGASTQIATEMVIKAPADGYTLLIGPAPMTANPWLYPNLPYNISKDLEPIILLNLVPSFLMVNAELPVKSVSELVNYLKARPGKTSYASAGNGTLLHLGGEWFKSVTGTDATHIPYKGSGPAVVDLAAGQVQYSFENLAPALAQIQNGKIRVLAVAGHKRAAALPDIPTLTELGFPPFEEAVWFSILGPNRLPKDIVTRLNTEVNLILANSKTVERFKTLGMDVAGGTPDQLRQHILVETEKWGKLIREKNIKAD